MAFSGWNKAFFFKSVSSAQQKASPTCLNKHSWQVWAWAAVGKSTKTTTLWLCCFGKQVPDVAWLWAGAAGVKGGLTWYCVGRCPCLWLGVGIKWSVRTFSAQIILWFCVTCMVETKNITKPLSWRAWKFSGESWSYLLPGKRSWGRFSYELCELWEPPDKNPELASLSLFHFRRDTNILPGFPLLSWSYLPFASLKKLH